MAQSRTIPDYPEEIKSLSMFHPEITTRPEAENYVSQHSLGDGSYIIRPNTDNDPSFVSITISISENKTCNARVLIEKNVAGYKYFISDKQKFETVNDLLSYYREHRIINKQGIDNLRLTQPLRKKNTPRSSLTNQGLPAVKAFNGQPGGAQKSDQDLLVDKRSNFTSRTRSESQISLAQSDTTKAAFKFNKHGGSLKGMHSHQQARAMQDVPGRARATSENSQFSPNQSSPNQYANSASINQNLKSRIKCRPPAPLPRVPNMSSEDSTFYYSSIQAKRDFFLETYKILKESDKCECGLQLIDSQLDLGWTIHRSNDPGTPNFIFFQKGERTTWDMPAELLPKLTSEQIQFIIFLYLEGNQSFPPRLKDKLERERQSRQH